jgi:hypothetical protein
MRTCAVYRQARIEYQVFLDGLLRLANIPSLTFLSQGGAVAQYGLYQAPPVGIWDSVGNNHIAANGVQSYTNTSSRTECRDRTIVIVKLYYMESF